MRERKYKNVNIMNLFQGIGTMFVQSPQVVICRIALIFVGFLLVYYKTNDGQLRRIKRDGSKAEQSWMGRWKDIEYTGP